MVETHDDLSVLMNSLSSVCLQRRPKLFSIDILFSNKSDHYFRAVVKTSIKYFLGGQIWWTLLDGFMSAVHGKYRKPHYFLLNSLKHFGFSKTRCFNKKRVSEGLTIVLLV